MDKKIPFVEFGVILLLLVGSTFTAMPSVCLAQGNEYQGIYTGKFAVALRSRGRGTQRGQSTIPDRMLVYALIPHCLFPVSVSVLTSGLHSPDQASGAAHIAKLQSSRTMGWKLRNSEHSRYFLVSVLLGYDQRIACRHCSTSQTIYFRVR